MTGQYEVATDWKQEYRMLVREFEASTRTWEETETLLRRTASQLAIAALGQSELLDRSLEAIVEALRGPVDRGALKAALDTVSDSLRQLPRAAGATQADAEIALLMRELVERFAATPVFREASRPLAAGVERALADNDWVTLARGLADTVADVTTAIERQRSELESFLEEITSQLERFQSLNDWNREANAARIEDNAALESAVDIEIHGIRSAVDDTGDVATLKRKVQARLDAVATELRRFRASESARQNDAEVRTAALDSELSDLRSRTKELTQLIEEKEDQLLHDSLTGVHSRYAYERRMTEEFHRWQRHGGRLAFAIWDIDRFKGVNDRLGHSAGDKLLKLIGGLLNEHKRHEDFVARIGGEEFALILPATGMEQAVVVAERIRQAIAAAPFHFRGAPERITVSCGLSEFSSGDTPDAVYQRADRALYRAKEGGRNRCETA